LPNINQVKENLLSIIALFTLLRYQQVLPTKGLSPLPIPHSDENCYIKIEIVSAAQIKRF
jgi:hypothetical protein